MKRLPTLPVFLLLLALTGTHCHRTQMNSSTSTLKGKLVVDGPCGFYAIQVLSGNIDPSRIQRTWKYEFGQTDTIYSNVFRASNICVFGGYGLSKNDTFTFRLTDSVEVQNCMICEIAWPAGLNVASTVTDVHRQ